MVIDMAIFSSRDFDGHENVLFFHDKKSDLKAIIAVHDTTLGPALGGTRMWDYASEQDAINDVLRLSRGMTYKSSLAGLNLGGGKSVIIGNAREQKTDELFLAFGRAVDQLNGNYIAAEDVGTTVEDLEIARRETPHIVGITEGKVGNPSPATAWGVFNGLKAAAHYKFNKDTLRGIKVAVQGLGNVGYGLCEHLAEAGAELVVSDIYAPAVETAVEKLNAKAVSSDDIYHQDVDIFAPCALGAVLNDETIPRLKAKVVAGAANNQLAEDRHGTELMKRGILYAPDYAINAGGIIVISHEGPDYDAGKAMKDVARIYDTSIKIFKRAEQENISTAVVADRIAMERIELAKHKKREYALAG
jgi:leucine dehydrogenase